MNAISNQCASLCFLESSFSAPKTIEPISFSISFSSSTMPRNKIIIHPASTPYTRQRRSATGRVAEVAGGTAAECAAVWCCGPCTVVNLIVLAVYKIPAGLCRKAIRRGRHRRMMKKGILPAAEAAGRMSEGEEVTVVVVGESGDTEMDEEVVELEKEMWDRFYATGFWRSASQREE